MLRDYPNTVILNFHGIFSDTSFNAYQGDSIGKSFPSYATPVYPNGIGIGFQFDTIYEVIENLYEDSSDTPVDIEISDKQWNPNTRIVDLSLSIKNDGPELMGSYWYNVIVTEDNIMRKHQTVYGCATPTFPVHPYYDYEYINSWVARKLVFWSEGKSLIETSWPEQHTINQSISFSINPEWISQNCKIAVNVYKKADSLYNSPVMQAIQEPVIGWTDISESETLEKTIIGIFPNPAIDIANIHLSIEDKGMCSLKVFDLNGKFVKHLFHGNKNPGLYNVEFQTNILPKGTYFVLLETSSGKTTKKIIIQ